MESIFEKINRLNRQRYSKVTRIRDLLCEKYYVLKIFKSVLNSENVTYLVVLHPRTRISVVILLPPRYSEIIDHEVVTCFEKDEFRAVLLPFGQKANGEDDFELIFTPRSSLLGKKTLEKDDTVNLPTPAKINGHVPSYLDFVSSCKPTSVTNTIVEGPSSTREINVVPHKPSTSAMISKKKGIGHDNAKKDDYVHSLNDVEMECFFWQD